MRIQNASLIFGNYLKNMEISRRKEFLVKFDALIAEAKANQTQVSTNVFKQTDFKRKQERIPSIFPKKARRYIIIRKYLPPPTFLWDAISYENAWTRQLKA